MKTASPEPVDQGTNLTYTLQVTNNGPPAAQGVTVYRPDSPAKFRMSPFLRRRARAPTPFPRTTVSCSLGNLSVGGLVVITINVSANTFSSSTLSTNTATVSATTGDPNLSNNTASFTSTIAAPTAVQLASFRALPRQGGGVLLEWKTRAEIRNLGFNVFRLDGTGRQRLNPSIIAGSALANSWWTSAPCRKDLSVVRSQRDAAIDLRAGRRRSEWHAHGARACFGGRDGSSKVRRRFSATSFDATQSMRPCSPP